MQACLLLEKASTSGMHRYLCLYKCFLSKALLEHWHLQNNETQQSAGTQMWTWIKAEQTMTKHKNNSQSIFSFNKTRYSISTAQNMPSWFFFWGDTNLLSVTQHPMFSLMKSFLKGKLPRTRISTLRLGSLQEGHRFFDASRLNIYCTSSAKK